MLSDGRCVGSEPVAEPRGAGRGAFGDEEAGGEPGDLLGGEQDVAEEDADDAREREREARRQMHDVRTAAERALEQAEEFVEGVRLGADGVDHGVFVAEGGIHGEGGHIFDVDGAHAVAAVAGDGEDREAPQQPGDVVDEHVLAAEDDGRPQDRVRKPRLLDGLFEQRLAAVVRQRRGQRRVGDADVHDAPDAGSLRSGDQRPGVVDGAREVRLAVREAHPVRVVEDARATQALDERVGAVEVERGD